MNVPGPKEMASVLSVVDALQIHREAVRIPLDTIPGGALTIDGARLVVTLPSDVPLVDWLADLPARIAALPGRESLRAAEA